MKSSEERIGSLYMATCKTSGKSYLGITITRRRWSDHLRLARQGKNTALYNAIRKYGPSDFDVKILIIAKGWKFLCELEKRAIVVYKTRAPRGYNMTEGGDGAVGVDPERIREGLRRSPRPPMSVNGRLAQGERSKAFWADEVNKRSVSLIQRERWNDPKRRERHKEAIVVAFNKAEEKTARSERSKRLWEAPEYRNLVYERATAATRTEENRKAQSERIKAMWADPEKRAMRLAGRRIDGN